MLLDCGVTGGVGSVAGVAAGIPVLDLFCCGGCGRGVAGEKVAEFEREVEEDSSGTGLPGLKDPSSGEKKPVFSPSMTLLRRGFERPRGAMLTPELLRSSEV